MLMREIFPCRRAKGDRGRRRRGERTALPLRGLRPCGMRRSGRTTQTKRVAANATTLVLQNWCRGRDSNPHSYCHYPLKIACLPVPPPRRQKVLYAKLRRLASLFSELFPFRPRLFRPRAGASGDGTWSIFSLQCFAFQTIRPAVSWKKRGFSAHFGPGGAGRLAFHLFQR